MELNTLVFDKKGVDGLSETRKCCSSLRLINNLDNRNAHSLIISA